jgi:hypothetical protein
MSAATRGPVDFPVNTGQNAASCTGAVLGAGQFKGRYRVGGEVALLDAEGGSNISGADFAHAIVEEIDNPASSSPVSSTEPARADVLRYQLVQPGPLRQARHRARPACATRAGSSNVTRVLARA